MKKYLPILLTIALSGGLAYSQNNPAPTPSPRPTRTAQVQQRPSASFDLAEYGVAFHADPRLIVMMAALEAAGFDPTPSGREPSAFRAQVRNDLAGLDPDLRNRLRSFYERNKLPPPALAADQAARYVSLALALGPLPTLEAPERSDELPAGLLDVLDFAPLVREFYRRSGIEQRMVSYTRAYQAEGDRLRKPAADLVIAVLNYLHTRPITVTAERVLVKAPAGKKKKNPVKTYTVRDHDRHFFIVPDLLAAPGAINFRVIGDEYYAIVPEGTDPAASELRRAYLQYVIDPLMLRFNREIAGQREQIKQLIAEREKAGAAITPDVFLVVSRSLVSAADARFEESTRIEKLSRQARATIESTKDQAARAVIAKEAQAAMTLVQDETVAKLAEDYERGAVLAFFFADQLKGIESTGFDIAAFFIDMMATFDAARESRRPVEYAEARQRAQAARQTRLAARQLASETPVYTESEAAKAAGLVKHLSDIEGILRLKDYINAETRLKDLLKDYPREPRIFFALAQTASFAAADATDEDVQAKRLNNALANYRLAIQAASPETDRGLASRAHAAMGRIYAFLDKADEASKEFDEAIRIGDVRGGAYKDAMEGKKKLTEPQ
ncbi:MAG: tetratricopeptide repeat protein [Pyrinomonadaceae bacterium]